jgi:hypothetical protein
MTQLAVARPAPIRDLRGEIGSGPNNPFTLERNNRPIDDDLIHTNPE